MPCSAVTIAASSSVWVWSSSRKAKSTAARFDSELARQSRAAATAVLTAASTSAAEASGTSPVCRPVAGSCTGAVRPEAPGTRAP